MIMGMYLPTGFMEEVPNNSNDCVDKRRVLEPNIKIWDQKHVSAPFDIKLLYHLFALILYMRVVQVFHAR